MLISCLVVYESDKAHNSYTGNKVLHTALLDRDSLFKGLDKQLSTMRPVTR